MIVAVILSPTDLSKSPVIGIPIRLNRMQNSWPCQESGVMCP